MDEMRGEVSCRVGFAPCSTTGRVTPPKSDRPLINTAKDIHIFMYFLKSARIGLRRFQISDCDFIVELWNDPDYIANVADRGIRTSVDAERYFSEKLLPNCREGGFGPYLVELIDTSYRMGFVGLFKRQEFEDADIGFAFLPSFRRMGYALESAQLIESYGRTTLGLKVINGFTSTTNRGSQIILSKLGLAYQKTFRMEGYEGDTKLYSKVC